MATNRINVGMIAAAHGIRGEVKLRSFTTIPEDIAKFTPLYNEAGNQTFAIHIRGKSGELFIASIEGITTRNDAEMLKGKRLYADGEVLPESEEGEFYHRELIGLTVKDAAGNALGKVHAVHNYGASDVIEIMFVSGETEMFPFKDEFFPEMDMKSGVIVFQAPDFI